MVRTQRQRSTSGESEAVMDDECELTMTIIVTQSNGEQIEREICTTLDEFDSPAMESRIAAAFAEES